MADEHEDIPRCVAQSADGVQLRRVKRGRLAPPARVCIRDHTSFWYHSFPTCSFFPSKRKSVEIGDVLDVRRGFSTDALHNAARKFSFRQNASKEVCFSVIVKHRKFLHKSIDFVADSEECSSTMVDALKYLLEKHNKQRLEFDERTWLLDNFRRADVNHNGKLSFPEIWKLLKKLNLQISEDYARAMFTETEAEKGSADGVFDEEEFIKFFAALTDRPEIAHILRLFSSTQDSALNASDLCEFLTKEQQFNDVDQKKAEMIIETYETSQREKHKDKLMGSIGFRRLLQSRWGNILKPGHETIFQDMDHPLSNYYINSSHNTYLTGLQLKGEATVEGYVSALKKGARLLELDLFDGEHGEPCITHKRTLITAITLRDVLRTIEQFAFVTNPFPVILTIENHVGLPQQKVMTEIFQEVLGDKIYIRPEDGVLQELPSPNALRHKYLLRGKKIMSALATERRVSQSDDENAENRTSPDVALDPEFSKLISLPSVKLSNNIYQDLNDHPIDGSPSLSENKVVSYMEGGTLLAMYTSKRLVKSYPKGLRQDSSNMDPVPSWICGVQSVAMNMQTAGEQLDLVHGLFRINGSCGYVLKPAFLIDGFDARLPEVSGKVAMKLSIGIISGQYLPKPTPANDVVDPYVTIEIFGIPADSQKQRTKTVMNNGFNPQWNETFHFDLHCPELALFRLCVKDFDSTSVNDFVGEFTVPVSSMRAGYSHVRLNTGYGHTVDGSAALLVRIAFD